MSTTAAPLTDATKGYLSEESKRRFTIVAGVLGAGFFVLQFLLPFVLMFALVMPLFVALPSSDIDEAVTWNGDIWYLERIEKLNWSNPAASHPTERLRRVRAADLEPVGPSIELGQSGERGPRLLPVAGRLWIIGTQRVSYYDAGGLHTFAPVERPARASRPFAYRGQPAVIVPGKRSVLAVLVAEGGAARWEPTPLVVGTPNDGAVLDEIQAVDAGAGLVLLGEFCDVDDGERECALYYRALAEEDWRPLASGPCGCGGWSALLHRERVTVVVPGSRSGGQASTEVITLAAEGPRTERLALISDSPWSRSRAMSVGRRLVFVTEETPGSPVLWEARDGRFVQAAARGGWLPFPGAMMALMTLPHLAPMLLSILLALVLTSQMRRHRVPDFSGTGRAVRFATLWQRALAQLVDLIPMVVALALPIAFMARLISHPERLAGRGPTFIPLAFLALAFASCLAVLCVLLAYSYFEGRSGRTPGKWMLGIRVVGTDLKPCGFGRAFLRNLLTIVDGFFNFLVGALLVALTENWQRLGDLAARTIVVSDGDPT